MNQRKWENSGGYTLNNYMLKTEKPMTDDFQVEEETEAEDDEKGPAVLKSEILAAIA